MTLDRFGAGCRCLLYFRENLGKPYVEERSFIRTRLGTYPEWAERPGAASNSRLLAIAGELELARSAAPARGYEGVLSAVRAGEIVLIRLGKEQAARFGVVYADGPVALAMRGEAAGLTAWLPTPDGRAETLFLTRAELEAEGAITPLILFRSSDGSLSERVASAAAVI